MLDRTNDERWQAEGRAAFEEFGNDAECPYLSTSGTTAARTQWWIGFLDARTVNRVACMRGTRFMTNQRGVG